MKNRKSGYVETLTVAAMLVALAVVVNLFYVSIPIGNAPVLKISFGGPFIKLVGLLFGPVLGGIAGAMVDLLVHLIRPMGAWIPELTLVELCKGAAIALLFIAVRQIKFSIYNVLYLILFIVITLLGAMNLVITAFSPNSAYSLLLAGIGKRADYLSIGLLAAGAVGLAAHLLAWLFLAKKDESIFERYLRLLPVVGLPCLVFTVVNTLVLQKYGFIPTTMPFILVCIPRVIEEFIQVLYNTYVLIVLMQIYKKVFRKTV